MELSPTRRSDADPARSGILDQLRRGEAGTVAIVDDDARARRSASQLLESHGYRALMFASGEEFLGAGPMEEIACVLLDIRMPGRSGLDVLRALAAVPAAPPVVVLTGHADTGLAVEAMKLGAIDLIEKPFRPAALLRTLARAGTIRAEASAADQIRRDAAASVGRLTQRQKEVLGGMAVGEPNKVIAWKLGLSVRTVEAYRAQLIQRLGARSTAEAVRLAVIGGLEVKRGPAAR
jgi:two-component system response regulator FixJ